MDTKNSPLLARHFDCFFDDQSDLVPVALTLLRQENFDRNGDRRFKCSFGTPKKRETIDVGCIPTSHLGVGEDRLWTEVIQASKFAVLALWTSGAPSAVVISRKSPDSFKGHFTVDADSKQDLNLRDIKELDMIVMSVEVFYGALERFGRAAETSPSTRRPRVKCLKVTIPHDKIMFFERKLGLSATAPCDENSQLTHLLKTPPVKDCQHMAARNKILVYATPRELRCSHLQRAVYKHKPIKSRATWPPQVKRYGTSIYWTQKSGKEIIRWRDSEDDDPTKATVFCNFDATQITVRRVAASDAKHYNHLTVAAVDGRDWKVLHFPDDTKDNFVDLKCPFRHVDSLAVMNNVIFALGNPTDSIFPSHIVYYRNGKWSEPVTRQSDLPVNAFFPMNGVLYLLVNGIETAEVYEPYGETCIVKPFEAMTDIAGYTLIDVEFDNKERNSASSEIRNEL